MTHHDKARELVERLRDDYTSYGSTEAAMEAVDLITAQAEENRRLREALQRAYDHVLKDAPNWFETGSHEQKALETERQVARAALSGTGEDG